MLPIKETVFPSHKNKNPSDATVIARLDKAFAKGQLPWVKTPYWRDGWFGRGHIQLTHRHNYEKMAERTGKPLLEKPSLMLDPWVSAEVAVIGMAEGLFTRRKLADYQFPDALELPPAINPRRIINGPDGTDAKVADYHRKYYNALRLAEGKTA
jgi:predicted chitinase